METTDSSEKGGKHWFGLFAMEMDEGFLSDTEIVCSGKC